MKKINIILLCSLLLMSILSADSADWGLKKPSPHIGLDREIVSSDSNGQKIAISISSLTSSGDLSSDYQSGMSVDFLINCNKSCSLLGKELNLGLGFGITPMCNDDSDVDKLNLGSLGLHVMPSFSFPVDMNFGAGLAKAPGQMGVGMMGYISMDFFYKLPKCDNMSLGIQYKQYVDPEDGELNFSKLGTLGLGFRVDG